MRRGFIYNQDLCVGCRACSAACILENGWNAQPRTVWQINPQALVSVPVINISMACNHCAKAACLEGCPAGALFRDQSLGAVMVDENNCLGCNYCTWTCPFDAPKTDSVKKIILKCDLCSRLLAAGGHPACATACPTGALGFGNITDEPDNKRYLWMPEKDLEPALEILGTAGNEGLKIIPPENFSPENSPEEGEGKRISNEWSLIFFSFLSSVSVALMWSMLLNSKETSNLLILSITILPGLISLLHLSHKLRAWRAVTNIFRSPLSREIIMYLVYTSLTIIYVLSGLPELLVAASASGLILLQLIDSVYTLPDSRVKFRFHSGQTFLTGLMVSAFFSGMTVSFCFVAIIKLISGLYFTLSQRNDKGIFAVRFLRLAILVLVMAVRIRGLSAYDPIIICIFLAGEFIDRWLFYYDFTPENIRSRISGYIQLMKK